MSTKRIFTGEIIGTFILVFIGCGSVSLAIIYEIINSLFEVALFWTLGVILGIYCSSKLSGAHLNPAVSIAMLTEKKIKLSEFFYYLIAQFIGALIAGFILFKLIKNDIEVYDLKTACIFGEYFPNPTFENLDWVSLPIACFIEILATFSLVYLIFIITNISKIKKLSPTLIGLSVGIIIYVVAPYTQCCMNPARDIAPRIIAHLNGWEQFTFNHNGIGWLVVYILAPLIGGVLGALTFKLTLKNRIS
ncbi:MAG: aquaporin [Flavobacteriales bacterium]|nr:aquaporin [Flavobacteriales bacterium]